MSDRYLLVGLGNPGSKYEHTRHNVGFRTVEELARRYGLTFGKTERKAQSADGMIRERRVLLAKPQTFMNLSGEAVRALVDFYKIAPSHILVITDDMDIPLGTLRMRKSGSAGGQNGVKSVLQHMGTQEINRLKLGIGRPPGRMDPAAYVLEPFKGDDEITARLMIDRAADAAEAWLHDGVDLAMSRYNGSIEGEKPTR